MKHIKKTLALAFFILSVGGNTIFAQEEGNKIWVSGNARSVLFADEIDIESSITDTVTAKKLNSGHTLGDFDINIRPNDNIFVRGTLRVRNDHGGFWGSGTSFDLRQLYMKALIADAIRLQIGDINYKLTDYTFHNNEDFLSNHRLNAFEMNRNFVHQDMFYTDDQTWRQQGMALDFGLNFGKLIEELTFDMFTFRLNASNFGSTDDQFISGGLTQVKVNDLISLQGAFSSVYEIEGTGNNEDFFKNNVGSGAILVSKQVDDWNLGFKGEMGSSLWQKNELDDEFKLEDYFAEITFEAENESKNLEFELGFRDIGPNFRSVGAQTQRVNFTGNPAGYTRYTNEQSVREFGMFDLYRDVTLYNFQLTQNLKDFRPSYGNMSPYGNATPNRRLLFAGVEYEDAQERFETSIDITMGGEVIGQGTSTTRQFMAIQWEGNVDVSKFLDIEKSVVVELGIWNENTTRESDSEFIGVDLSNTLISAGLTANVYADLDFIFGLKQLGSNGNELVNRRDDVGQIIGYDPMETDRTENLLSTGIQYRFNEKSKLNVLWNSFRMEEKAYEFVPYTIQTWSINFQMKF